MSRVWPSPYKASLKAPGCRGECETPSPCQAQGGSYLPQRALTPDQPHPSFLSKPPHLTQHRAQYFMQGSKSTSIIYGHGAGAQREGRDPQSSI